MNNNWLYTYIAILTICLAVMVVGVQTGLVYKDLSWKIAISVCVGFSASASMNIRKRLQERKAL